LQKGKHKKYVKVFNANIETNNKLHVQQQYGKETKKNLSVRKTIVYLQVKT